ncbi:MAG: hypothetical protein IKQ90_03895 [Ruminococcus sp.]|nr:hypothetical protein [Ruminococcus sp.]
MFDENQFRMMPRGSERFRYLRKCIAQADAEKDFRLALRLRFLFIEESIFGDDNYSAIVMFPEYMALYDQHPDLHDKYDFMYAFKWIIEDIQNFPQVTPEKAEELFTEFAKRCREYGYSLRAMYMKRAEYYIPIDAGQFRKNMELFRREASDEMSDGTAHDLALEAKAEMLFGDASKAVRMLNDQLARGLTASEVPEREYGIFAETLTRRGEFAAAEHYADLLLPMISGKGNYLMETGFVLLTKAYTDLFAAINVFRRHIHFYVSCKNTRMQFYFAEAAARLFDNILSSGKEEIKLVLPADFPLYNMKGTYSVEQLRDYFRSDALSCAEKFDNCYGTTFYTDKLNAVFPESAETEITLPAPGGVKRNPVTLAVPYVSMSDLPDFDEPAIWFTGIKDLEYRESTFEDGVLIVGADDTVTNDRMSFVFKPVEDTDFGGEEFYDSLISVHRTDQEKYKRMTEECKVILTISTRYDPGCEERQYQLLLRVADRLNFCQSPCIADVPTFRLLSSDWVKFQAKSSLVPDSKYMYQIITTVSDTDEELVDIFTSSLGCVGSREIAVPGVTRKNVPLMIRVVEQIAESIVTLGIMNDEGIPNECGITLDNELISFVWRKAAERHEAVRSEDAEIFLCLPGRKETALSDLDADTLGSFAFRDSRKCYRLKEQKAAETFTYAAGYFRQAEDPAMIVGFDIIKDDGIQTVYVNADHSGSEKLTGTIFAGDDGDMSGQTVEINTDTVFYWQLRDGSDVFSYDDAYYLKAVIGGANQ